VLRFIGFNAQGVAGGAGAFEAIASATGTGSSGTITFSSIPSTYQHLQLRIFMRLTANQSNPTLQFNSDTGSNYAKHLLLGNGSVVLATGTASTTSIENNLRAISTANIGVANIVDIHDYASTTKYKTVRHFTGWDENGSGQVRLGSGLWMNTNAINSITINATTDSFTTDSTFALYGVKGA